VAEVEGIPSARRSGDIHRQSSTDGKETSDRIWKIYYSSGSDITYNIIGLSLSYIFINIALEISKNLLFAKKEIIYKNAVLSCYKSIFNPQNTSEVVLH